MDSWGGVERALHVFHAMYPSADWYSSYIDRDRATWAKHLSVQTTFLQHLPKSLVRVRSLCAPLYPIAFESLDFREYDLVISITSAFAKGIITHPHTKHVSYILTPPRYLWGQTDEYLSGLSKIIATPMFSAMRRWDGLASRRPDHMIAISSLVADRIHKYYQLTAPIVHPPFDTDYWADLKPQKPSLLLPESYLLVVSRLEPYKRVELAIAACELARKNLIIVGRGTQLHALQRKSGSRITFLQDVSDEQLAHLYAHADALLMPQQEDFGMVALEASWWGCPVISYIHSGAMECIVQDDLLHTFDNQNVTSIKNAIAQTSRVAYNKRVADGSVDAIRAKITTQFGLARFRRSFFTYTQ